MEKGCSTGEYRWWEQWGGLQLSGNTSGMGLWSSDFDALLERTFETDGAESCGSKPSFMVGNGGDMILRPTMSSQWPDLCKQLGMSMYIKAGHPGTVASMCHKSRTEISK